MKRKLLVFSLALFLTISTVISTAYATYTPPTSYGAPTNVGVIFNGSSLIDDSEARWSFDIGYGASDEIRLLENANADGSFEAEGYNSLGISVQADYKLDSGKWRSEQAGFEEWVSNNTPFFNAEEGNWTASNHMDEYVFTELFPDEILPGGNSYFDSHTMQFRVRFSVTFFDENIDKNYEYFSPWSTAVSYNNKQTVYDSTKLLTHSTKLLSAELKKNDDGSPYLDFKTDKAHDDIQLLNSISDQRIFTNVWLRVNGGQWVDAGTYLWLKEQFTVDAKDYFNTDITDYEAAVYEAKFRYSFDNKYYPVAEKTGDIFSPFSNVISHGMPAYEGASSWAITTLNRAQEYGFITDRIKGNMSGKITREEFAEIAVKLYEKYTGKTATVGNASFVDTTNPEILKAANIGLVAGIGSNKYGPDNLVTREQMATILLNGLKVLNPTADFSITGVTKFSDDSKVAKWASTGVYYCSKSQIVSGVGKNKFEPKGNATREQSVIVCTKAYEFFKK